jgi:hypothetical protein
MQPFLSNQTTNKLLNPLNLYPQDQIFIEPLITRIMGLKGIKTYPNSRVSCMLNLLCAIIQNPRERERDL